MFVLFVLNTYIQWLILYHTVKAIVAGNETEYKDANRSQQEYMQIAWSWLAFEPNNSEERKAVDLMQMDVAQRFFFFFFEINK